MASNTCQALLIGSDESSQALAAELETTKAALSQALAEAAAAAAAAAATHSAADAAAAEAAAALQTELDVRSEALAAAEAAAAAATAALQTELDLKTEALAAAEAAAEAAMERAGDAMASLEDARGQVGSRKEVGSSKRDARRVINPFYSLVYRDQ
jgi:hypothetical protein